MKFLTITFLFFLAFCFSQEIDCPVENGVIYYNESYEFRTKRDCWNIYKDSYISKSTNVHSDNPISVISVSEGKISDVLHKEDIFFCFSKKRR